MKYILPLSVLALLFTGCSEKEPIQQQPVQTKTANYTKSVTSGETIHQNLNNAILSIADQLFLTNIIKDKNTTLILTSFVDLDNLNKTTTFGRLLSESMFNELHIRSFRVTDFRGQNAISVNAEGEFHITRDVEKLKDHISATEYVVVGTYVKFEQGNILLNARIIDSETGEIISTARVLYKPENCM